MDSIYLAKKLPFMPSEEDVRLADLSVRELSATYAKSGKLKLRVIEDDKDGAVLNLPTTAVELIIQLLSALSKGKAVTVIPYNAELTTQQAAEILNCSRDFVVRLCDNGELPYRKLGTHRKIRFDDLMEYDRIKSSERLKILDKLSSLHQEMGGYEKP
jgi:excisionase family DNA binding protein